MADGCLDGTRANGICLLGVLTGYRSLCSRSRENYDTVRIWCVRFVGSAPKFSIWWNVRVRAMNWIRRRPLDHPNVVQYLHRENACLTFVTPSKSYIKQCCDFNLTPTWWFLLALLAGDRSLVNVVAHEISHSWFGNHVTYVPLIVDCFSS